LHLLFNVIPHSNGRGYYDQDILHRLQETFPVYASSKRRIAYASCAEKTTEFRGRYIVACASVTYYQHYFHLICQVLARILMALQCPEADGCGILLPAFVPQWGLEFLALAGVDKERITIMPRNHSARVEEALVLPLKWDVCPTEIAVARQLLSQRFPHDGDGVDYYLTRRGATNVSRSLSNEQEFIEILQARNFTIVDPLDHSLEEQMRLFSRARTIVSSGSSAYANMLYAPSGTRIILIAPSLFWGMLSTDLATACGHDFSVLFGEFLAGEQHTANPHRPYTADPVAFQKLLDLGSA
jgi:capsular polysaccharide biosynthesis protein